MQDKPNEQSAKRSGVVKNRVMLAYTRPELKVFGKVHELTEGSGGTSLDGHKPHKRK